MIFQVFENDIQIGRRKKCKIERAKSKKRERFFLALARSFFKNISAVFRIRIILMRIRICGSASGMMDPDPGPVLDPEWENKKLKENAFVPSFHTYLLNLYIYFFFTNLFRITLRSA